MLAVSFVPVKIINVLRLSDPQQPQQQHYTSAYYPQVGAMAAQMAMPQQPQMQQAQPQMQMPQSNAGGQPGQGYDPAGFPPPSAVPGGGPVIPQQQQAQMPVIPPPPDQMPMPGAQPQFQQQPAPVVPQMGPAMGYIPPAIYGLPAMQANNNPLPAPPRDLYDMTPYRNLLKELPQTTAFLTGSQPGLQPGLPRRAGTVGHSGGGGGVGGLSSLLGGKKKEKKGLFRSSTNDMPSSSVFGGSLGRSNTTGTATSFLLHPTNQPPSQPSPIPIPQTHQEEEQESSSSEGGQSNLTAPVRFDHTSPLSGFMNHSPHRVLYQNKLYPSALHLLEALKFVNHRPDLAERIRAVKDVHDVYPLTAAMNEFARTDWGQALLGAVSTFSVFLPATVG